MKKRSVHANPQEADGVTRRGRGTRDEALQFDQGDLSAVMAKYLSGTGMTMRDFADSLNKILAWKLRCKKVEPQP